VIVHPTAGSSSRRRAGRPAGLLTEAGRVEAFSDGVLAIAVTLLVLDLHAPSTRGAFADDLLHQAPTYLAYLASFITIGIVWVNHHVLFTRVRRVDPALLWGNLLLLGTSSVLPFPTAVLARALEDGTRGDRAAAVVLYSLIAGLQALSWLLVFRHLHRTPGLLGDERDRDLFAGEQVRAIVGISAYTVLALLSLLAPLVATGLVLVAPVFHGLTSHGVAVRAAADASADQREDGQRDQTAA